MKVQYKGIPFLKAYNQRKLKVGFLIDRILRIFSFAAKKRSGCNENPKKILVVQSHLIGDLMMAIPMLKALKRKYPEASLYLLANDFAKEFLKDAWYVDKIYTAPFPWGIRQYSIINLWRLFSVIMRLRRARFDLAIDAQIDFRNAFLMFLIGAKRRLGYDIVGGRTFLTDIPDFPREIAHLLEGRLSVLQYLGIDITDKRYELPVNEEARRWVETFLHEKGIEGQNIVAIHPGASVPEKLWRSERFAAIIDYLYGKGFCPILVEGPGDNAAADEICSHCKNDIVRLKTSLLNVIAFFEICSLVICLDSAASHFASAVNTPAIVLYGPQLPQIAKPIDENIIAVWREDMDCRPCVYSDIKQCKNGINECMDKIQADEVISKIDEFIQAKGIKAGGVLRA
ncbi:MAG: glycosyltransferase family 9 protein [Deltaproteobacteria bacterium]|nr:glycosyltransferase family 9 protein [Deltaproteobacteria bacterium]